MTGGVRRSDARSWGRISPGLGCRRATSKRRIAHPFRRCSNLDPVGNAPNCEQSAVGTKRGVCRIGMHRVATLMHGSCGNPEYRIPSGSPGSGQDLHRGRHLCPHPRSRPATPRCRVVLAIASAPHRHIGARGLLHQIGHSLRAPPKENEGAQHPDCDARPVPPSQSPGRGHLAALLGSCCRLDGCASADFGQPSHGAATARSG
jgi:hypothetical protein